MLYWDPQFSKADIEAAWAMWPPVMALTSSSRHGSPSLNIPKFVKLLAPPRLPQSAQHCIAQYLATLRWLASWHSYLSLSCKRHIALASVVLQCTVLAVWAGFFSRRTETMVRCDWDREALGL